MITHPLANLMAAARRSRRRWLLVSAACQVLTVLLGTLMWTAAVGSYLRPVNPAGRIALSLVFALAAVAGMCVVILSAARQRDSDVRIARRLRGSGGGGDETLLAAVDFLHQPDRESHGSLTLRTKVIADATTRWEGMRPSTAADRPAARSSMMGLLAIALIWGIVLGAARSTATTAATCVLLPLHGLPWPQRNLLRFLDPPARLARGSDFRVELVDSHGEPPSDVTLHLRFEEPAGTSTKESMPMERSGSRLVAVRPSVQHAFEFWAEGGDDHGMAPMRVEVVDPVAIQSLRLTVHPPPYTGLPPYRTDEPMRALVGSTLEIAGEATASLSQARLHLEDGRTFSLKIDSGGILFSLHPDDSPWLVTGTSSASLELVDTSRLASGASQPLRVIAVADAPPSVELLEPTEGGYVTPWAVIGFAVRARDDLAVREISLAIEPGPAAGKRALVLWKYTAREETEQGQRSTGIPTAADVRMAMLSLRMADLGGTRSGEAVAVRAVARDSAGQEAAGELVRFQVVEEAEFLRRINLEKGALLAHVERALAAQQSAAEGVRQFLARGNERPDGDAALAPEVTQSAQREVSRRLTDPTDGVARRCNSMLVRLAQVGMGSGELALSVQALRDEVVAIDADEVRPAIRELAAWKKQLDADPGKWDAAALAACADRQAIAMARLEKLLQGLSDWESFQALVEVSHRLIAGQRALVEATRMAARARWGSPEADSEGAALERSDMARRQVELASEADHLVRSLEQLARLTEQTAPWSHRVLAAATRARESMLVGQMRSASRELQLGRLASAGDAQSQALRTLQDMRSMLDGSRGIGEPHDVAPLAETRRQLQDLVDRQDAIRGRIHESASGLPGDVGSMNRDQEQIRRSLAALRAEMTRMRLGRPSARAAEADAHAAKVSQFLSLGRLDEASQAASAAANSLREAMDALANEELSATGNEGSSSAQQVARIFAELGQKQAALLRETIAFKPGAEAGAWKPLADRQRALAGETRAASELLFSYAVHQMAAAGAVDLMAQAARRVEQGDASPQTQFLQERAARRLDMLARSLVPADGDNSLASQGEGATQPDRRPGAGEQSEVGNGDLDVVSLRLIADLQADLNARFSQIRGDSSPEEWTQDRRDALQALSWEQHELARMVFDLSRLRDEARNP